MRDTAGQTLYCYDRYGQLRQRLREQGGHRHRLQRELLADGRLQRQRYPDGSTVAYQHDRQGRIATVTVTPAGGAPQVLAQQIEYAPFGGGILGWRDGRGRPIRREQDGNGRVTTLRTPGDGLNLDLRYDPAGNLSAVHRAGQATPQIQFNHDGLNRLQQASAGGSGQVLEHYSYDATGNRQQRRNATGTTRYQYATASHRLTRVGGVPRRYDAAGHTTQIGSGATALTLLHGADGRLRRVERQGQAPVHYGNDGEGRRVRRRSGEEDTTTLYDADGHWLGDYDRQGRPIQQAIWLEDLPIGLLVHDAAIARLHALYPDHLGTPRAALDLQRDAIVWRWELSGEAFGASAPNEDPDGDGQRLRLDLRFPGQRHDPATGLHENHHRDYDPSTGRYLQSDPIGVEGGINTYGYAEQNPLLHTDPTGQAVPAVIAGCLMNPWCAGTLGGLVAWMSTPAGQEAVENVADAVEEAVCSPTKKDPCEGLRRILKEYEKKLKNYTSNPMEMDNKGFLKNALKNNDMELYYKIYSTRIASLKSQIENFKKMLEECERNHGI